MTRDEAGQALRAMRSLPDDRRRALTLRFVEEMSTAEIAGVLGRSEGAVRVLIHRALGAVATGARPRARRAHRRRRRRRRMSDDPEVDALVADRYLDALLAAVDRHAADAPSDAALDPDVREAARVLRASLVRVHPSFRFEERLAGRLADLAASQASPALAAAGGGALIELPGASPRDPRGRSAGRGDPPRRARPDRRGRRRPCRPPAGRPAAAPRGRGDHLRGDLAGRGRVRRVARLRARPRPSQPRQASRARRMGARGAASRRSSSPPPRRAPPRRPAGGPA